MNWLTLMTTICLRSSDGQPYAFRPVINMADVAKFTESRDYGDYLIRDISPPDAGSMKKVPCVPGYNCDDVKCAPVSIEDQSNEGDFLHGNPKTTCVPAKSNPLREGEWNNFYYDRQGTTTSTMAPYLVETTTTDKTTTEELKCDNVAKCRVHNW